MEEKCKMKARSGAADVTGALEPNPVCPPKEPRQSQRQRQRQMEGKISKLPRETRDSINRFLRDGVRGTELLAQLGEDKNALTKEDIAQWEASNGYKRWLREQERLSDLAAKREFALAVVNICPDSKLQEASVQLAAARLYDLLDALDVKAPKSRRANADAYTRLVNALTRLSRESLAHDKYRLACEEARKEINKVRNPTQPLSEAERIAILDHADEILGLR